MFCGIARLTSERGDPSDPVQPADSNVKAARVEAPLTNTCSLTVVGHLAMVCHLGHPLLEISPRIKETPFDSPNRDVENASDFIAGATLVVVHDDRPPLAVGQESYLASQGVDLFLTQEVAVNIVHNRLNACQPDLIAPALLLKPVAIGIPGDAPHPCIEVPDLTHTLETCKDLDDDVLCQILRLGPIAGPVVGEAKYPVHVVVR